jgi:signal transduction histidine kinase
VINFDDELKKLKSDATKDRLKAARFFAINNFPEALEALKAQRRIERVRHVKTAIDHAINHIDKLAVVAIGEDGIGDTDKSYEVLRKYSRAKAIDEFAGILLHELAPKLGVLKSCLIREIAEYNDSDSIKQMDGILQIFDALKSLRKSALPPETQEIDLSQLIKDTGSDEVGDEVTIHFEGTQPCITKCDPALLRLALSNGFRNAYESLSELPEDIPKIMVVSWGLTDIDCWISVIDEGSGLKDSAEAAFRIGTTNKSGHTGFGMGIMRQAMESLGGNAELSPVATGGAKLLLRWGNFGD